MAIISLLILYSCNDPNLLAKHGAGTCLEQKDLGYAKYATPPSRIYKISEIVDGEYSVSIKHNNTWYYSGKRSFGFFEDNEMYSFQTIECPKKQNHQRNISSKPTKP